MQPRFAKDKGGPLAVEEFEEETKSFYIGDNIDVDPQLTFFADLSS